MSRGGFRTDSGRKKGSKAKPEHSSRIQRMMSRLLFEKPGSTRKPRNRLERMYKEYLDDVSTNTKNQEMKLRAMFRALEYVAGTPPQMAMQEQAKTKTVKVLELPDKQPMNTWMERHGQKEAEIKTEKPN